MSIVVILFTSILKISEIKMRKASSMMEFVLIIAIASVIAVIVLVVVEAINKQQKVIPKTITMEEFNKNNKTPEFNNNDTNKLDKRFIIELIITPQGMTNLTHITDTKTKVEYIGYGGQFITKLETAP